MSGVVLYSPEEARRNEFSVEKFHTLLGAELHTPDYDGPADFVINRTNDPAVARRFESQGVRVFNPAAFCALANDKDACYRFMAAKGVEILPIDQTEPPMVVKPKDGHGGQGVRLIRSGEPVPPQNGNLVYQAVADTPGQDLRVWLLGGEIYAACLRRSATDFRSNYCLGGSAAVYPLSPAERAQVSDIAALVQADYYAIDFVRHQGRWVFNELEDTVGARMLYDLTSLDPLADYCRYIQNCL